MQIAKNDGMRGFYYGFAAFMIFEFLWRSIAEKSVDAVNKFIPEKNVISLPSVGRIFQRGEFLPIEFDFYMY